jgi:hypothetical protein
MEFYKIQNPTTKQIFDAIISGEYTPIESIKHKAKQIYVLLKDHFDDEVMVTFMGVSNTGGVPIFFGQGECLADVAHDQIVGFDVLSGEEREHEIELLACYAMTYEQLFHI